MKLSILSSIYSRYLERNAAGCPWLEISLISLRSLEIWRHTCVWYKLPKVVKNQFFKRMVSIWNSKDRKTLALLFSFYVGILKQKKIRSDPKCFEMVFFENLLNGFWKKKKIEFFRTTPNFFFALEYIKNFTKVVP